MPLIIRKVPNPAELLKDGDSARGMMCVGPQDKGLKGAARPNHAVVQAYGLEDRPDVRVIFEAVGENRGERTSTTGYIRDGFFSRKGAAGFIVTDPAFNQRFLENLDRTKVQYSVLKVVGSLVRDFFSKKETRENQVSERIAKYCYQSYLVTGEPEKKPSKMFCSQLVFQNLHNTLAEEAIGFRKLMIGNERNFEEWRANHIDEIRDAVKQFPPELKHASSSITPTKLVKALSSIAERCKEAVSTVTSPKSSNAPIEDKAKSSDASRTSDAPDKDSVIKKRNSDVPSTTCKPSFVTQLCRMISFGRGG